MSDSLSPKEIHDMLLSEKPEDATHEEAECPFCNDNTSVGGGDTMTEIKTYTEEDLSDAVREALAPVTEAAEAAEARANELASELEALRAANEAEETQTEVEILKSDLDKATLRAEEAEARVEEVLSYFNELSELEEIAKYLEDVKAERLDALKDFAFSEERIEANIDRWVAMSEEDFAALVEDYEAIHSASKASLKVEEETEEVAPETAMSNTRSEGTKESPARLVYSGVRSGTDIRRL